MKKIMLTLVLACAFVLSMTVNILAEEGQIPTMGKNCPQNTTCLADNQTPASSQPEKTENSTIFSLILDYMSELFGN